VQSDKRGALPREARHAGGTPNSRHTTYAPSIHVSIQPTYGRRLAKPAGTVPLLRSESQVNFFSFWGSLLLGGYCVYVSANQQLLVAPVRKESCCPVERVRGEPAWEIKRKWKDWLGYRRGEQNGV